MMLVRLAHLWKTRKTERVANQFLARSLVRAAPFALLALITSMTHLAVAQSLDYETYKKTVEPIFAKTARPITPSVCSR
jgi:hypothetical protein